MDLFATQPDYAALLARIEALEAAVFAKAGKPQREKPDDPMMAAVAEWDAYRKGKGWTAHARTLNHKRLRELAGEDGELALKIVRRSIERGWRGLFAMEADPKALPPAPHKTVAEAMTPCETPLERHMGWLRQQRHIGAIDDDEFREQAIEARRKYGVADNR